MSKEMTDGALVGRFERKLDAMRRVRIPSEWFALMGQPKNVVVLRDPSEKCIDLLSEDVYAAQVRSSRRRATKDAEARRELQILEGEVEHLTVNARHCIRIRDKLLRFATIKERVALLGSVRYAKLWNPKLLRQSEKIADQELAAALKEAGFGSADA